MSLSNRAEVSNRSAVIAAMLYLATFLALIYGGFALVRHEPFIDAFLFAFPRALIVCALFYVGSAALELRHPATKSVKHPPQRAMQALPR